MSKRGGKHNRSGGEGRRGKAPPPEVVESTTDTTTEEGRPLRTSPVVGRVRNVEKGVPRNYGSVGIDMTETEEADKVARTMQDLGIGVDIRGKENKD